MLCCVGLCVVMWCGVLWRCVVLFELFVCSVVRLSCHVALCVDVLCCVVVGVVW